tara:strand:+ start:2248 stop:2688 length:441 start_codon:yes stop_codon:yes gene_type:complete
MKEYIKVNKQIRFTSSMPTVEQPPALLAVKNIVATSKLRTLTSNFGGTNTEAIVETPTIFTRNYGYSGGTKMLPLELKIETDTNEYILENPYFKNNLPPVNSSEKFVYDFLTPVNSAILGVPGGMIQEVANLWISKIKHLKTVGDV